MRAVNIAKLGDFKMTTSVDVVWVIAANRNCCCQHAPKMRALTPLQRRERARRSELTERGDMLTLSHEKGVFCFKSENRTVLLTSFGVAPFTGALPFP